MRKKSSVDELKDRIFSIIQNFLKNPPVVIWGSGATAGFGMPRMSDLNDCLKSRMADFDGSLNNLEKELDNPKYEHKMPQIRSIIWNEIKKRDSQVLILTSRGFYPS